MVHFGTKKQRLLKPFPFPFPISSRQELNKLPRIFKEYLIILLIL